MFKFFSKTTVFVVLFFIPRIVFGSVIINEIAWMGTVIDYNDEWIEIFNNGDQSVDLTGWKIEATDGSPTINLSGNVPANGYFLLERTDDNSVLAVTADQIYTGALGNSGENLKLKDNSANTIDEINAGSEWPAGNNTTKQTMERTTTGWQTSLNPGGTPKLPNSSGETEGSPEEPSQTTQQESSGALINNPPIANAGNDIIAFIGQEIEFDGNNSTDADGDELHYEWNMGNGDLIEKSAFTYKYNYPGTYLSTLMIYDGKSYAIDTITVKIQAAEITINEFLPNPSEKDEEGEWIEIFNDSESIIDISDWQIDDDEGGSSPFIFPQNTLVAPKSYLVFSRQITGIALNNDKDKIRLLLPEGAVFQEISYEKPPQGKSSAKTNEGFVWSIPTPGAPNVCMAMSAEIKKIIYQGAIKTEATKEPSQSVAINYVVSDRETQGGYTEVVQTDSSAGPGISPMDENNPAAVLGASKQKALAKETISEKISDNIILVFVLIILFGLTVGLLLARFRRKKINSLQA